MKRYKLVRIVDGRFYSANTRKDYGFSPNELEYTVGKVTEAANLGIACYKRLEDVRKWDHLDETMRFHKGKPIAILEVEPMGEFIREADR
ncbi:hypothetical protein LCGC14_1530630, partial [marine sediment metagenome]